MEAYIARYCKTPRLCAWSGLQLASKRHQRYGWKVLQGVTHECTLFWSLKPKLT